mgnify:CR=1 FL=1
MTVEYKLAYDGAEIDERLRKVDEIDDLKELVGTTKVSEQIEAAVVKIYTQASEPANAPNGSIWIKI